jgi:hypothetical protein
LGVTTPITHDISDSIHSMGAINHPPNPSVITKRLINTGTARTILNPKILSSRLGAVVTEADV